MRAFVSVDVPELVELPGLRAAAPEAPRHFTLRFFGSIDPPGVEAVGAALGVVARSQRPFRMVLSGFGAFPDWGRPRIVFARASRGGEELEDLAERLSSELAARGFAREPRPFAPHVTVLRVRGPADRDRARRFVEAAGDRPLSEAVVTELVLKSSELGPSGPTHRPIGRYALGPGP